MAHIIQSPQPNGGGGHTVADPPAARELPFLS